jgi:hypothetical protein
LIEKAARAPAPMPLPRTPYAIIKYGGRIMTKPTIEQIIHQAVIATRVACERSAGDAFRATENRLYAYPLIWSKVIGDKERLEEIKTNGIPAGRKDIIRFMKAGQRLSSEDIQEAIIQDLSAEIARDECEVEMIEKALTFVENDPYASIIKSKYFEGKNDEEIAELVSCDGRTVRRNKNRLVKRLAVFLYGATAVA